MVKQNIVLGLLFFCYFIYLISYTPIRATNDETNWCCKELETFYTEGFNDGMNCMELLSNVNELTTEEIKIICRQKVRDFPEF